MSMNELYNSKITNLEPVERNLSSSSGGASSSKSGIAHEGTLATLESGEKHLIHNTPDEGGKSFITSADNMSKNWKPCGESRDVNTTVGKAMDVAESKGGYNLLTNNCIDTQNNLMKAPFDK